MIIFIIVVTSKANCCLVLLVDADWVDESDDEMMLSLSQSILDYANTLAVTLGNSEDYIFLNYAANGQDVISSYGEENVEKMIAVSQKYDPAGLFQKQVPGGSKIPM